MLKRAIACWLVLFSVSCFANLDYYELGMSESERQDELMPWLAKNGWSREKIQTMLNTLSESQRNFLSKALDSPERTYQTLHKISLTELKAFLQHVPQGLGTTHPDMNGFYFLHFTTQVEPEVIDYLISLGANPQALDIIGRPPFFYAESPRTLKHLLKYSAEVINLEDLHGRNAIFFVETDENLAILRSEGVYVISATDKEKNTPLFFPKQSKKFIYSLVDVGIDVNQLNKSGKNALFYAQTADQVTGLVAKGINVKHRLNDGRSAIFFANNLDVVKTMVKVGLKLDDKDNQGTPAILALAKELYSRSFGPILEFAASQNFNFNIEDSNGNNLLHLSKCSENLYDTLIQYRVNPDHKNKQGLTPLQHYLKTADNVKSSCVTPLISSKTDWTWHDDNGDSILHFLTINNLKGFDAVNKALRLGAAKPEILNAQNKNGITPLHRLMMFAGSGYYGKFENEEGYRAALKTPGFNYNLQYQSGKSALGLLIENCKSLQEEPIWRERLDFVLSLKPKLDLFEGDGNTILHQAVLKRCDYLVDRLIQAGVSLDTTNASGLSVRDLM